MLTQKQYYTAFQLYIESINLANKIHVDYQPDFVVGFGEVVLKLA
jgi:hypothetical protein